MRVLSLITSVRIYFTTQDGSFLMISFSGPRIATPCVFWPTPRNLLKEKTHQWYTTHEKPQIIYTIKLMYSFFTCQRHQLGFYPSRQTVSLYMFVSFHPLSHLEISPNLPNNDEILVDLVFSVVSSFFWDNTLKYLICNIKIFSVRFLSGPLSEGATGASTAENTESFASSTSCCVNFPARAHSTPPRKADNVCVEFGSLGDCSDNRTNHD